MSIAAFKLGFRPVEAFDIDPDAVRFSHENFEKNDIMLEDINLTVANLSEFKPEKTRGFAVVTANILAPVLIGNRKILFSMLKPEGRLLLSGILEAEYISVKDAYMELGLVEESSLSEGEWTSGVFKKPQKKR